jgi:hypothetical protein
MKCTCPACGKTTAIEADVGDFPTRCQRCRALLRVPHKPAGEVISGASRRTRREPSEAPEAPSRPARIEQGALAGLLISRSTPSHEEPVRIIHAHSGTRPVAAERPGRRRLLRPESLREVARAAARQKALRRATLRGNHQALGFLGKLGFVVATGLCLVALLLEARLFLRPAIARADSIRTIPVRTSP